METPEFFQQKLLEQACADLGDTVLPEPIKEAYFRTPRHQFVKKFRMPGAMGWYEVTPETLSSHLQALYANHSLILWGRGDQTLSTISHPTAVLLMLKLLELEPGQKVLEIGAGSGWNAALLGRLVGDEGQVVSLELIPELARSAQQTIAEHGPNNVRIIAGDGGDGFASSGPYDRVVFTAGSPDLSRSFYEQVKPGGLLLVVFKIPGGGDNLCLLRRCGNGFKSELSMPSGFVMMQGNRGVDSVQNLQIDESDWRRLGDEPVARRPFWWGGKGKGAFALRTQGIRSFLSIVESEAFCSHEILDPSGDLAPGFGLWLKKEGSLAVAYDDALTSYGNRAAEERLLDWVKTWVDFGMPSSSSFDLSVFPIDFAPELGENQWLVRRRESQFLWSLNGATA